MTQEEKVMFLMRLAVETFNAHYQVSIFTISHHFSCYRANGGD